MLPRAGRRAASAATRLAHSSESTSVPTQTTSVRRRRPSHPCAPRDLVPSSDRAATATYAASRELKDEIGPACTRCKLHTLGRKQVVFGVGNPNADLMFVGEAPGADEDEQGEPFVGRAGSAADEDHRGDRPARARRSTSPTSSSAGRRAIAIPSPTKSSSASRSCSARSTRSSRR